METSRQIVSSIFDEFITSNIESIEVYYNDNTRIKGIITYIDGDDVVVHLKKVPTNSLPYHYIDFMNASKIFINLANGEVKDLIS